MSCLLLKGSSENPAPPKEEVKGPEVGGCKRGHEREAKIIVKMEATDVHSANAQVPRASVRPPPSELRGTAPIGTQVSHKTSAFLHPQQPGSSGL